MSPTRVAGRGPQVAAAFQTGVRRIDVDDVPMPWPRSGEVLVELTAVGICGSDLHYFRHGRIGPQALRFPQILGHEPAGIVAAVGRGVRRFREGQRVAIEPGIACGTCRACRMKRPNLCYRMRFLGGPDVPGAFQRFLATPVTCVKALPPHVDDDLGSAMEPIGVAMHALRLVHLQRGDRVGIIGAGPIGLTVLALARVAGADIAAISDGRRSRRTVARRLGARDAVTPEAFVDAVRAGTQGYGATVIFECSGDARAVDQAVLACERGGRIALVGIPDADVLPVDPHAWRVKELALIQVRRSRHTWTPAMSLLRGGDLGLKAAGFFSTRVGLEDLQSAFEELDDDASRAVKVIVDPRQT